MAEFNNNRVLFGFINGHGVLLEKLLKAPPSPPIYGYALTQEDYDELTPETDLYYAIYDDAPNQAIYQVVHCTAAEYEVMQKWERALYLIENNSEIVDVKYGEVQVNKLYLNGDMIWSTMITIVSKSLSDIYRSVSYQTIWNVAKNAVGVTTNYWYLQPMPSSYDYNGKPQFRVYKFYSDPGTVKFSNKYSGDNTLWASDSTYYRQDVGPIRWNRRLSMWEFAGTSSATAVTVVGDYSLTFTDGEIVTTVPLKFPTISTQINPQGG